MHTYFTEDLITKLWVWFKKLSPIFLIVLFLVFDQGQDVYAYASDFTPTSFTINDTSYNEVIRAISNYPILIDTYEVDGQPQYLWRIDVSLNIEFPAASGYYNQYSTATVSMNYPSNSNVLQTSIIDYDNSDEYRVSMYAQSVSSANNLINAYFRIAGRNQFIESTQAYQHNLVNFTVELRTNNNVSPQLSFNNISSNIRFNNGKSLEDMIVSAIENSDTAQDIADILTLAQACNANLGLIYNRLGVMNTTLNDISGYAYQILEILQTVYPTEASSAMDDAQEGIEGLKESMESLEPSTIDSNEVYLEGGQSYLQLTQDGDSEGIFWYLNNNLVYTILILVFSLAIISYILYGGK